MFSLFRKFLPNKSYLGVDIGTTSVKVVELTQHNSRPALTTYGLLESYGHLERLNNAIQTSGFQMIEQETANLLKMAVKHANVSTKLAIASLPSFSAFTSLLEMPMMSGEDTTQAMTFQVKQYVPLPITQVTIDWLKVGERQDEQGNKKQQVLLISVPNDIIKKYQSIFKMAGLELAALEVEGLSSARSLTASVNELSLIIDIGSRSTAIAIAQNGLLKFIGQTDFAGGSLTQTIASGLNIRVRRAEDLKKLRGLIGTGGEYELSTLMLPILDVIINEAKRVKDNFERSYGDTVKRVILSGGGANLAGIEKYVSGEMGLPTTKANPFSLVTYPQEIESLVKDLGPEFSVAIGLAIRNL